MKWIVYQTLNIVNNKIYIGVHKTENPDYFDGYIGCSVIVNHPSSYANPETPFQYAVKKYGPSKFKRTVLKIFDTAKEAFALEAELVNREFIARKDTYNIHLGGIGGRIGRPIYQFDFNGNLINTWALVQDAADFYYCDWMTIYYAQEYKVSRKGYYWSYNSTIDIKDYVNNCATPVYKYDASTLKCIDYYYSQHEAARKNNIKLDDIQRAIKGGYRVMDAYYSSKVYDVFELRQKIDLKNSILYVYGLDGSFITELCNKNEIKSFFNIKNEGSIRVALRSGTQYKNYQLSLQKVDKLEPINDKRKEAKKVEQYSLDGKLIKVYDTVTKAREEHGVGVSRCLRGQQKHCHNFIFKYKS